MPTSAPSILTLPAVGLSVPLIRRSRVVLPAPFGADYADYVAPVCLDVHAKEYMPLLVCKMEIFDDEHGRTLDHQTLTASQQVEEEGDPAESRYDPHRQLGGANRRSGHQVGQDEESGPADGRHRQQGPVVASPNKAHRVGVQPALRILSGPAKDTAAAVARVAATINTSFVRSTFTPT